MHVQLCAEFILHGRGQIESQIMCQHRTVFSLWDRAAAVTHAAWQIDLRGGALGADMANLAVAMMAY